MNAYIIVWHTSTLLYKYNVAIIITTSYCQNNPLKIGPSYIGVTMCSYGS